MRNGAKLRLTANQSYALLERFGCYVQDICDKCGQLLGPVRYTRRGELGEWCSRECRGDVERPAIRKGGRPRKHKTNAERQRVYRHRLSVTKPPRSFAETKDLQAQKTPLSHTPFRRISRGEVAVRPISQHSAGQTESESEPILTIDNSGVESTTVPTVTPQ